MQIKYTAEFRFDFAVIRVRDDGIVQINSAEDFTYTIHETLLVHEKINELTHCRPMLILHIPGKYTAVDAETRKFIAGKHGLRYTVAQAFVISSMAQKIIAHFFMRVNKPAKPTRFFSRQEDAEKWLYSFKRIKGR